jgi:hypothetical protein
MAPPTISLENRKEWIKHLYLTEKRSVPYIVQAFSDKFKLSITVRTLQRKLREWEFHRQIRTQKTEKLQEDLKRQFYQRAARNDTKLTRNLILEGYQVSRKNIVQFRHEFVGKVRLSSEEFPQANAKIDQVIKTELQKGGSEYGRKFWRTNMRNKSYNIAKLYNVLTCFPASTRR